MTVEDVFVIKGRGLVATGRVESGSLLVGDAVQIDGGVTTHVQAIEMFRKKKKDEATAGENVGLLFAELNKGSIGRGSVLTSPGGFAVQL